MEILVPIAGIALVAMIADQIRRLVGQWVLNGTIRRALDKDPASVPLLVAKLEATSPISIALIGWVLLVLGAIAGVAAALSGSLQGGGWVEPAATLGVGLTMVAWDRFARKPGAKQLPPAD